MRCNKKYLTNRLLYHERTCTLLAVNVTYPDVTNLNGEAVVEATLHRDPTDLKFHCLYCAKGHKDAEGIKVGDVPKISKI